MSIAVSPDVYEQSIAADPSLANILKVEGQKPKPVKMKQSAQPKREDTELEAKFAQYWHLLNGPELKRDYTGWTERKLELDFYHEPSRVAIEINGGIGKKSGHTSWHGIHRDYDKLNACNVASIDLFVLGTDHMSNSRLMIEMSMIQRHIERKLSEAAR